MLDYRNDPIPGDNASRVKSEKWRVKSEELALAIAIDMTKKQLLLILNKSITK